MFFQSLRKTPYLERRLRIVQKTYSCLHFHIFEYFFVSFYTARLGGFFESSGLNQEHFSEKNKARLAMLNLDVHGIYKFFGYEVL